MATNEAAKDLRKKLQLEAKLRRKINSYHDRVVSEFRSIYARTGTTINTNAFNDELVTMLNDHWSETVSAFSTQIGPKLPKDIQETPEERNIIEQALLLWLASGIVKDHAQEINVTTQRQVNLAVDLAADDELVREQTGREYRLTLAAVAAGTLRNNLKRRVESIVATETQIPAEAAKATEAEVLSGISPSIQTPTNRKVDLQKEWVSVGDSKVRQHHLDADGQRVGINESFVVNGELLRYPGDASQGASAGNIINCRCSAVYDEEQITNIRREENIPTTRKPPKPKPEQGEVTVPTPPKPTERPIRPKPKPTPPKQPLEVDDFQSAPETPVRVKKPDGLLSSEISKNKKLTENQFVQIKDYTEDGYKEINGFMRNPNKFSESTQKEFRKQVGAIRGAINKSELTQDTVLYRGTNSNKINAAISKMKPGDKIPLTQFQSTSTARNSALEFTAGNEKPVLFKINAAKGTRGLDLDQFKIESLKGEREILLSDQGEYSIRKITEETGLFGQKVKVVELDYGEIKKTKQISKPEQTENIEEIEISIQAVQRMYFSEQEMFYNLMKSVNIDALDEML